MDNIKLDINGIFFRKDGQELNMPLPKAFGESNIPRPVDVNINGGQSEFFRTPKYESLVKDDQMRQFKPTSIIITILYEEK